MASSRNHIFRFWTTLNKPKEENHERIHKTALILLRHRFTCKNHVCLHSGQYRKKGVSLRGIKKEHKNIPSNPERFLQAIEPFRGDLVVGVECIFCWYWLADLCEEEGIDFVLGHALYMKSIHGVKTKNDRIDSLKIARLLRGGNFPVAYVYPPEMRATRSHHRREKDIMGHFPDPVVQLIVETDLQLIDHYDPIIKNLDKQILALAKGHDRTSLNLLRGIHGVGEVLALTMLYEIHTIERFPSRGEFCSYARLVKGQKILSW